MHEFYVEDIKVSVQASGRFLYSKRWRDEFDSSQNPCKRLQTNIQK